MSPGGELLNGQCMRRSSVFFCHGGGVQAQRRENSFDFFFMFVLGFFSPKFSGDAGRGPTIYEGGPNANIYRI